MFKLLRTAATLAGILGLASPSSHLFASAQEQNEERKLTSMFVNELPTETIELFWENTSLPDDHPDRRRLTGLIPPRGGHVYSETTEGHEFSYIFNGIRHFVTSAEPNSFGEQFVMLVGDADSIKVRCELTASSQAYTDFLDIIVKPYWAPRAVSRFLELVRQKYYDGVVLNRVVPKFLTQFGIAADYAVRTAERDVKMWDDFPRDVKFEPGFMSFSGSGPDGRTTEIFAVMPGVSDVQLSRFGENPWEVPFAYVDNVESSALTRIYSGYGDMTPFGRGPDTTRIYEADGYTNYLPKTFPKLDYIERCYIVGEVGIDNNFGAEL